MKNYVFNVGIKYIKQCAFKTKKLICWVCNNFFFILPLDMEVCGVHGVFAGYAGSCCVDHYKWFNPMESNSPSLVQSPSSLTSSVALSLFLYHISLCLCIIYPIITRIFITTLRLYSILYIIQHLSVSTLSSCRLNFSLAYQHLNLKTRIFMSV